MKKSKFLTLVLCIALLVSCVAVLAACGDSSPAPKDLATADISLEYNSAIYDGIAKKPAVLITISGETVPEKAYTVEYSDNINLGTAQVKATAVNGSGYIGLISTTFTICNKNLSDATISLGISGDDVEYNGKPQEPSVSVVYKGIPVSTSEYMVSFSNNTNPGTAKVTVTAVFGSSFAGSISTTFTITAIDLNEATITLGAYSAEYNGTAKTPSITVQYKGTTIASANYTVAFSNNTNAGTATVTVTPTDPGYIGSKTANFTISALDLSNSIVSVGDVTYDGTAKSPTVTVTCGGRILDLSDFSVSCANNTNVGTATATVTGKGNYIGSKTANFTISALNLSNATISVGNVTYDGTAKSPTVTVKYNGQTISSSNYTVSYLNNTYVGTATANVTAKGSNCAGSNSTYFTISPLNLNNVTIELGASSYVYDGTTKLPSITVKYNGQIISSSNYSIDYANNTLVGTATASISPNNSNYTGSKTATFKISALNLSNATISVADVAYDGIAKTPAVTVTYNGKTISSSNYTVSYSNNTNPGTATANVTAKGSNCTGSKEMNFNITKSSTQITVSTEDELLAALPNYNQVIIIKSMSVTGTNSITIPADTTLILSGSNISFIVKEITNNGTFAICSTCKFTSTTAGKFTNNGSVIHGYDFDDTTSSSIKQNTQFTFAGTTINNGSVNNKAVMGVTYGTFTNKNGASVTNYYGFSVKTNAKFTNENGGTVTNLQSMAVNGATFTNYGTVVNNGPDHRFAIASDSTTKSIFINETTGVVTNYGLIDIVNYGDFTNKGTMSNNFRATSGTQLGYVGKLQINSTTGTFTNGTTATYTNQGTITITGGKFQNNGSVVNARTSVGLGSISTNDGGTFTGNPATT